MGFYRSVLRKTAYFLAIFVYTTAYPDHVPEAACSWMSPMHVPQTKPQTRPPPYTLKIYHPDVLVNMTVPICVMGAEPFKGMMVQAKDPEGNSIGSWAISKPDTAQTINCTNPHDTATHVSKKRKQVVSLKWIAPANYSGKAVFKAAIVKSYSTFWTDVTSDTFTVHSLPEN